MALQNNLINKKRIELFGIKIDPVTMEEAVSIVFDWIGSNKKDCKFVITPNVDHVVQVQKNQALQQAYQHASLVVTDGRPVVWAANLLQIAIPETVPGSDMIPAIFTYAQKYSKPVKVFLLGAMPGVADRAKMLIHEQYTSVEVVGTLSPDFGFDRDSIASNTICDIVNQSDADLLVLGLGAPKQELWIDMYANQLKVNAAFCVGATIDFIAGEKPRAPMWMRKIGLEWVHRLLSEPKRLAKRYSIDAVKFPQIVFNEWRLLRQKK
jgi:N-acetylglucosaminyldiphosphoundecaprenol N-acetyl-beta-D-mannosaminyltransferase